MHAWVWALGALTWASAALLPCLHRSHASGASIWALLALGPLALAAGLMLARHDSPRTSYALLAAFPISLALPVSRLPHDLALGTFSPGNLLFSLLCLAGYIAAASALCARPKAMRTVEHKPLGEIAPVDLEKRKQRIGQLTLAAVFGGGLLFIALSASETPAEFRENWGRAAPEGATLTALTAGIVGALALSIVGPGLRALRGQPSVPPEQRRRKAVWLSLVAVSGLISYWFLRAR